VSSFVVPNDVGVKWEYSNVDAGVLGLALARRAGTTFERLLQTRLTGPLGMTSTALTVPNGREAQHAVGYDASFRAAPAWNVPALQGAGSLHSSTNDLLTFLAALSENGAPLAGVTSTMLATRRPGPGVVQALGWWILGGGSDDEFLLHDGGTLGFASAIAFDPRARTGVIVLSNTANGVGDIARHLMRADIPLTLPAEPVPAKTVIALPPSLLDSYAGAYEPGPGSVFVVTRDAESLRLEVPGLPPFRLRPENNRSFFVPENTRVTVTFEVTTSGQVTALTLHSPNGDIQAKRSGEAR
jgi:CubicO group peptidase (beta-lactamase class C family)